MLMMGLSLFTACKEDDNPNPEPEVGAPEIEAANAQIQQIPGEVADIRISVNAPAGIQSIAVSGDDTGDVTFVAGDNNQIVSHAFTVPEDAEEGDAYTLTFTVTDAQDETATATVTVTASANPTNGDAEIVEIMEGPDGVGGDNVTWTADKIYHLNGFVFVNEGQTLTIEPGTVIKGRAGQAEDASALIVARGARIIAEGTAEEPIIFTALADDVSRTDDLPMNQRGLWGGLIILGNAPINHASSETNIEGIPTEETRARYGGNDPEDDSGILKYISIRHGGTNIGAGNEINGLTMGGVGRGTQISYIEVFANDDDGFEWFGGTVNTSHLASVYNQDDSFDWDFGWRGENQFWLAYQEPGFEDSDRGFESDGAHSGNLTASVFSQPSIYNMTMIGQGISGSTGNAMFFTEGTGAFVHNSIIMNFTNGIDLTDVGASGQNSRDRLTNGDIVFSNNIFYNIGSEGVPAWNVVAPHAPLATHLQENDNLVVDPQLGGIGAGEFNPLPTAGGAAFTSSLFAYPAEQNGFTYEEVEYIGAFGTENWMQGWTAADAYGLIQ